MDVFRKAKLALSVARLDQLPATSLAEVAVAGRSNAGKSSAINALTERRNLAFVARAPGKTRLLQLFELAPDRYLVDLPGYGYARVEQATRQRWGRLVDAYLRERETLRGLVLVMDIRHPLMPLDKRLLAWFLPRGLPVHVLLTKADKLSRAQANAALSEFNRVIAVEGWRCSAQLFSSQTRRGVAEARERIAAWLDLPSDPPAAAPLGRKIKTPG